MTFSAQIRINNFKKQPKNKKEGGSILKIIDGYTGQPHITSQQIADTHLAVFGDGNRVLDVGDTFSHNTVDNNTIQISDGVLMIQGRRGIIEAGEMETLTIENGGQGLIRSDLIVARYEKNETDMTESITLCVVKGAQGGNDPAINDATIIRNGDTIHDFALYRVRINGISIVNVEPLFTIWGKPVNITLLQSGWNNGIYTIGHPAIKANSRIELWTSSGATELEQSAYDLAALTWNGTQSNGSVQILAEGTVPAIDITADMFLWR